MSVNLQSASAKHAEQSGEDHPYHQYQLKSRAKPIYPIFRGVSINTDEK